VSDAPAPPAPRPPRALDHVALWIDERDALAAFLYRHLGLSEILRSERFTLVGAEPHAGKVTLFDAEDPREAGALERLVFGVADVEATLAGLPADVSFERGSDGVARFRAPQGLELGVRAAAPGAEGDMDSVVLRVADAARSRRELELLGFEPRDRRLWVGGRSVELREAAPARTQRPQLNHIAVLVESAAEQKQRLELGPFELTDEREAENTFAVFLRGSDAIEIEYVEHKADSEIF
jgi:catechol 2,3-dioxygenase-like lactoylglutathione lyase family enzyme